MNEEKVLVGMWKGEPFYTDPKSYEVIQYLQQQLEIERGWAARERDVLSGK